MLIGPAGVGKSGIVEGLAYYYFRKNKNYTIYQLEIGSLLAGTKYRGDLEEKLMDIMDTIKGENTILFIDEIHNIINNNTSENTIDIGNLLKPYLARSTIKCIGATTTEEYYKTIAKDKALARRFKNIIINEPNTKETINILNGIKNDFEDFYKIKYDNKIINKIVYSSNYFHSLNNPDKAIDIMDECGINTVKNKQNIVSEKILKKVIYNGLGINIKKSIHYIKNSSINDSNKKQIIKYLNLKYDKYICSLTVSKDNKIKVINDFKKIFNLNNESILELDVNDYSSEHTLSSLLGTSPGYVGYEDGGIITKHILRNNISLIIFNNYVQNTNSLINKKIINKILNNGYLLDYQGNKVKFINTVILFQTNKEKRIGLY
jgi:ATP-dependent Clp protease ATP-binding subunit ClpA